MANDVGYTPGAGALIKTDQDSGDSAHMQIVKLAIATAGVSTIIPASAANGLTVDVTRIAGVAQLPAALVGARLDVNIGASGITLPVSNTQLPAALVGGRLDVNIGASGATVPVSGTVAVTAAALPAALVGGNLAVVVNAALPAGTNIIGLAKLVDTGGANVASVSAGGALKVDASATTQPVSGTVTVNGTITANQGTAAVVGNAWPVKISDGTNTAGLTNVGGAQCVKVDVVQSVGAGAFVDEAAYTIGTGRLDVIGGVFKDAAASPADGQVGAARITAFRAIHVNIRKNDGTELGIAATPLRTDPTGTTTQPVSGTVTVVLSATTNAGATAVTSDYDTGAGTQTMVMLGIALPASGGAVAGGTATNPVRVDPTGTTTQPVSGTVTANQGAANATPWNDNLAQVNGHTVIEAASGIQKVGISGATGVTFSDAAPLSVQEAPRSGKWRVHVTLATAQTNVAVHTPAGGKTAVIEGWILSINTSDVFVLSDGNQSDSTDLYKGQPTTGTIVNHYARPEPLAAVNDVLRYSTGATTAGDLTVWGYEV